MGILNWKLRAALLIARRIKKREGLCTGEQENGISTLVRSGEATNQLAEIIESEMRAAGPLKDGLLDILNWLLANWEQILQIIMTIVSIFADDNS